MAIFIIILIVICFAFAGNSEEKTSGSSKTRKRSSETVRIQSIPDNSESKFFELSSKIEDSSFSINERLGFCEASLAYLPQVI